MKLSTDKIQAEADPERGIGWLTFNQPERRNAVSREMWIALDEAMRWFQQDEATRVVVLAGAGGQAFVSGADISEFDRHNASAAQSVEYKALADRGNASLQRFDKPLIAMIQGYCIGAGLGIALAADVRIATPGSRFGIPAAKLGLAYDYDGVAALARLVGPSVARDILFSARQLDTAEALAVGLINFTEPEGSLRERTLAYAQQIARNAPLTVKAAKAAVNLYERTSQGSVTEAMAALVSACFDSEDYAEGRRAFAEKRAPRFRGR